MKTFKCYNELLGNSLQKGDEVMFHLETGEVLNYIVIKSSEDRLYLYTGRYGNDVVFEKLNLERFSFCEQHYGYEVDPETEFPEPRPNDFEALTRVVLALFKIIEEIPKQLAETSETLFVD